MLIGFWNVVRSYELCKNAAQQWKWFPQMGIKDTYHNSTYALPACMLVRVGMFLDPDETTCCGNSGPWKASGLTFESGCMLPAAAVCVQHRILLRLAVVVMANIYSTALSCSLVILHSMITSARSTAEWTLTELMNTMHSFHVSKHHNKETERYSHGLLIYTCSYVMFLLNGILQPDSIAWVEMVVRWYTFILSVWVSLECVYMV